MKWRLTLSCRLTRVSRASESPQVSSLRVSPFSEASRTSVREGGEVIIRGKGVGRERRDRRKEERKDGARGGACLCEIREFESKILSASNCN